MYIVLYTFVILNTYSILMIYCDINHECSQYIAELMSS